jgi:predicted permease
MQTLPHDIVYAFRTLVKSPAYAALSILTLALGIGANTAIFSVVNGVLLKPLAYPHPEQLEFVSSTFPKLNFDRFWLSLPEWDEFKQWNRAYQSVGAYRPQTLNLGTPERPRRVNGVLVTPELMSVLGVSPLRGRHFTDADAVPNAEAVGIISYSTWRDDYGGDETVLGRVVQMDGTPTRIVAIMPRGYDIHDERIEIFLPLTIDPKTFANSRGSHFLYLIARRRDGVPPEAARADVSRMIDQWQQMNSTTVHTPTRTGNFIHLVQTEPLKNDTVGSIGTALWVLQGAVGFVLLIACANLANLLLARSESRQKEFAVRSALGASRWRLLRQFLAEGLILALVGGTLGAALGVAGLRALLAANPESIPRALEIALDWRVLAFTFCMSALTGVVFGMAPLLHLREKSMSFTLKEGGQRASAGSARSRLRSGLVMAEVALAVILVVGAGLLIRSFEKLMTADPGFNREHLTTFGVVLPAPTYPTADSRVAFFDRVMDRLRQFPGVVGVAAMTGLPPNREVNANDTGFEGYTPTPDQPAANIDYYQTVSVDYLKAMGIPIVSGRRFERADISGAPAVMVNETLEKTFYTSRHLQAVGHRVQPFFGPNTPQFTIIGVVRDVKQGGISKKTGTELYFLEEQGPRATKFAPRNMNVVVRSMLPEQVLDPEIEQAVHAQDPLLPLIRLRTMDQVFADSAARPRFLSELLGIFAALALALAAIGTYGILSYSVTERTKEIGIHMALGATRGTVLGMVLGQGMRLTVVGLVAGLAASFALTRLLQAQLFNVSPTDPATLTVVVSFIAMVAFVACCVPAQRATRVDPIITLREG